MKLPIYQVDAFTSEVFSGNPAAVVLLEKELPDETLQAIGEENNLSETAFLLPGDGFYHLRWFTPRVEVDLCGHATLASAFVLFNEGFAKGDAVRFQTRKSGSLAVTRSDGLLNLDFPSRPPSPVEAPAGLTEALGMEPESVHAGRDLLVELRSEEAVAAVRPRFDRLAAIKAYACIVTARGGKVDFVSRFFAPGVGIPEDPVTGSAHCTLVPFWARRLGKRELHARQLSPRGGELFCEDRGERVRISGRAVEYLRGEITF